VRAEDEAHWHSIRFCGLGGTDASVILGVNPWRNMSDLRREKRRGWRQRGNAAMRFGSMIEPFITARVAREEAREVREGSELGTLVSLERPWQLANVDGFLVDTSSPTAKPIGLEIKHCAHDAAGLWEEGPPEYYVAQLQHYMAVTGWAGFEIVCMVAPPERAALEKSLRKLGGEQHDALAKDIVESAPLIAFTVERDEAYIEHLCAREARAWRWLTGP